MTAPPDKKPFDFEPVMTPSGNSAGFRPFFVPIQVLTTPFPVEVDALMIDFASDGSLTIAVNASVAPIVPVYPATQSGAPV
ncbi:hypothetical protein ACXYUI_31695, partial [Klebsiella pneumoniae]